MAEPNRFSIREDDRDIAGGHQSQGAGPLATLPENKFKFSAYNYPIDMENLSHCMLFNINVHTKSKDLETGREQELGEVETADGAKGPIVRRQDRLTARQLGLTRRYKRVKRAISLYVPDSVVFDNRQQYEQASLIDKLGISGTAAITAGSSIQNLFGTLGLGAAGGAAAAALSTLGVSFGATASAALAALSMFNRVDRNFITPVAKTTAQLLGYAINPVIEVLYTAPQLRKFNFDFVFAPRSRQEADMVWQIIYEFRRHSAPELLLNGVLFLPPSEFEITFLRKTTGGFIENTNIPRMTTCVLEDVQVDYASSGSFVTFEDGMPVQIRMRLSFVELNLITREAIDKGY